MPETLTRFKSDATLYKAKMRWTVGRVREVIKRREILDSHGFTCKKDPNQARWSIQLDFGNSQDDRLTFTCTNHSLTSEIFVETLSLQLQAKNKAPMEGGFCVSDVAFGGANSDHASIGWNTNAKLSALLPLTEKFKPLENGKLYVVCKVKYYGNLRTHQRRGPMTMSKPHPTLRDHRHRREPTRPDLSRDDILSSLARDFAALSADSASADVLVVVGETRIPAHRFVLAARSPVFKEMLNKIVAKPTAGSRTEEGDEAAASPSLELKVDQKSPAVMDALIKFCYSGQIPRDLDKIARELLIVADIFQVKMLRDICSEWLAKRLNIKNAVELLIIAHLHDCATLKVACMTMVVQHATKFMAQEVWRRFTKEHPELLNQVCQLLAMGQQ